jgi:glycerate 2-kinase
LNEALGVILSSSDLYSRTRYWLSRNWGIRGRWVRVIAMGKAALPMAKAVVDVIGDEVSTGIVVVPRGYPLSPVGGLRVIESTHPLPSETSVRAGLEIMELARDAAKDDVVLFLISGGASSLVEVPQDDLSLEEITEVNRLLLRSGATIGEINTVRKHLSRIKGGRLGALTGGSVALSLIASDVPGDDPGTIASGPTVTDTTTCGDAIAVLKRRGLWGYVPPRVRRHLEDCREDGPRLSRVVNHVIARNMDVLLDLRYWAMDKGLEAIILTSRVVGEAREVGRFLASVALESLRSGMPLRRGFILTGGEPTVTVVGDGKGGRTTEICSGFALEARGSGGLYLMSIATDGVDGNMDAAGCMVKGDTVDLAEDLGIDVAHELARNNTHVIYERTGTLIRTGWTGSNLGIVTVVLTGI